MPRLTYPSSHMPRLCVVWYLQKQNAKGMKPKTVQFEPAYTRVPSSSQKSPASVSVSSLAGVDAQRLAMNTCFPFLSCSCCSDECQAACAVLQHRRVAHEVRRRACRCEMWRVCLSDACTMGGWHLFPFLSWQPQDAKVTGFGWQAAKGVTSLSTYTC